MTIGVIDYGVGNIANVMRAVDSIESAFAKSLKVERVRESEKIRFYDKIILPGVGAYGTAMDNLKNGDFIESINDFAKSGKYILGICLGMQLLFDKSSEFGTHIGLGLIEGEVIKFGSESSKIENVEYLDSKILESCESKSLENMSFSHNSKPLDSHSKSPSRHTERSEVSKKTQNLDSKKEILKIPHIGWNLNFKIKNHTLLNGLNDKFYLYFVHSYHAQCDFKYILATCDYGVSFPSIVCKNNILGIQPHPEKSHTQGLEIIRNFVMM